MVEPVQVAVLGAGGFIGAHLVRRLVAGGFRVRAVDRSSSELRKEALEGAQWMTADLTRTLDAKIAVRDCQVVFHLAADMGGVGYFHSDADLGSAMTNGQITLNVLRACQVENVARVFYASSACCYPIEMQMDLGTVVRLREGMIGRGTPDALYGAEKLHGLRLCSKISDARVGVLHTVYGPLQDFGDRRAKFPPSVAHKAIQARETGRLELWGDGRQLRSYLYIDDAVEKIMRVAFDDRYAGPVNIGRSGAISCYDVARLCLDLAGVPDAEIVTNPAEPSGVLARDCSNEKWQTVYGGTETTSYADGFGRFIAWMDSL